MEREELNNQNIASYVYLAICFLYCEANSFAIYSFLFIALFSFHYYSFLIFSFKPYPSIVHNTCLLCEIWLWLVIQRRQMLEAMMRNLSRTKNRKLLISAKNWSRSGANKPLTSYFLNNYQNQNRIRHNLRGKLPHDHNYQLPYQLANLTTSRLFPVSASLTLNSILQLERRISFSIFWLKDFETTRDAKRLKMK